MGGPKLTPHVLERTSPAPIARVQVRAGRGSGRDHGAQTRTLPCH
jgi:hypothetical protein